jgi:hypothetical protein
VAWVAHNLAHCNNTQSAKCHDRYNKPGSNVNQDFFARLTRKVGDVELLVKETKVKRDSGDLEISQPPVDFLRRNSAV